MDQGVQALALIRRDVLEDQVAMHRPSNHFGRLGRALSDADAVHVLDI